MSSRDHHQPCACGAELADECPQCARTNPLGSMRIRADDEAPYRLTGGRPATLPASEVEMAPVDADAATRAREARYAEAWNNAEARWREGETHSADAELGRDEYCASAILAEADAEQAKLRRAEVERLRQAGESLAAQGFEALDRAEAAEAELRALREGIEAVLDDAELTAWIGEQDGWMVSSKAIRALLAPSPAATTGEADQGSHSRLAAWGGAYRDDTDLPAPVSSGEAETGEAGEPRALPLHRTEAGYPNCSTCDGGGCPDCTDPA